MHASCIQNVTISHVKIFDLTCENNKNLYAYFMRAAHKISIVLHAKFFNIACESQPK